MVVVGLTVEAGGRPRDTRLLVFVHDEAKINGGAWWTVCVHEHTRWSSLSLDAKKGSSRGLFDAAS